MLIQQDTEHIWQLLQKNRYCTVSNHASDGTIDTRVMAFACNRDLKEFYLMTHRISPKVKGFLDNPNTSLLVFCDSKDSEECAQIAIRGKITVHREINSDNNKHGLQLFAEKTGMMDPRFKADQLGDFVFLSFKPREITLTVYYDILHNLPATKINL